MNYKFARIIALTVAVAISAGCVPRIRESNIYMPRKAAALDVTASTAFAPWTPSPLMITRPDGAVLSGVFFKHPQPRATVIYFGGNGFLVLMHYKWVLAEYKDQPVNIVMYDHRAYGASTGTGGFAELFADGVAIYDGTRQMVSGPIIVHGQSMGSFIAGHVAKERTLGGLILESTATNAVDWAHDMKAIPRPILRLLIEPKLRDKGNDTIVSTLDEPTVFITGEKDTATRPTMATALYKAAALPESRKRLVIVPGKGHNNASISPEFSAAVTWLLAQQGQ